MVLFSIKLHILNLYILCLESNGGYSLLEFSEENLEKLHKIFRRIRESKARLCNFALNLEDSINRYKDVLGNNGFKKIFLLFWTRPKSVPTILFFLILTFLAPSELYICMDGLFFSFIQSFGDRVWIFSFKTI